MCRTIVALCALARLTSVAAAATYFVDPGGSDAGPGSSPVPWQSLQHAAMRLVDSRTAAGLLEEEGVQLLEALAAQAALALETAQHRQHLVETAEALEAANRTLRRALGERTTFDQILGRSPAMQRVFEVLDRVVGNSISVLW